MTTSTRAITTFDAPALPPLAALQDRSAEAAERTARLREDGYAAGFQSGLDAAAATVAHEIAEHRRAAERLGTAAATLEAAARHLLARDSVSLGELADEAMAIGTTLAVELVGRELRATDEPVRDAIRRAITLVPSRGTPVVRVHPADLATAQDAVAADIVQWNGDVDIVADPGVEPGGCVVDVGECRIDAQIGTAIERLRVAAGDDRTA